MHNIRKRKEASNNVKINKEQLRRLAELPDKALWQSIRDMAKGYGYELPEKQPTEAEMSKIRAIMLGTEKINVSHALNLLKNFKKR